eukprot:4905278-Pyramimonas_sp.AAC.1
MVHAACDAQRHRENLEAACPGVSVHEPAAAQPPHTRAAGCSDCRSPSGGVGARGTSRLACSERWVGAPAQLAVQSRSFDML